MELEFVDRLEFSRANFMVDQSDKPLLHGSHTETSGITENQI